MTIALIGAGQVASALARGWTRSGHELLLGVRDPSDPTVQSLCQETQARARSPREAAEAAAVVVLARPRRFRRWARSPARSSSIA